MAIYRTVDRNNYSACSCGMFWGGHNIFLLHFFHPSYSTTLLVVNVNTNFYLGPLIIRAFLFVWTYMQEIKK